MQSLNKEAGLDCGPEVIVTSLTLYPKYIRLGVKGPSRGMQRTLSEVVAGKGGVCECVCVCVCVCGCGCVCAWVRIGVFLCMVRVYIPMWIR